MAKKDEVLKHKELGKVVVKQDNRDDGQKLKDFIKENISSMLGSDGEPDLGKIRDILGLSSLNGYELKFPGKGIANALYSAPIYKELKNIDENKSNKINENFIIKGDNLDALKILAKGYTNKIKMIYIDPPYNTMNNDFIYNDNFRADFDAIARISGLIDESGNKSKNLEEMERIFKGTRTHSAWLCFMYPRLKLARDLLKDDGVIFISIDDNEQANLKLLCDEIFGEENFVGNSVRQTREGGGFGSSDIGITYDYVLFYAKNREKFSATRILKNEKSIKTYFNKSDEKGDYHARDLKQSDNQAGTREERPFMFFPILELNGKVSTITKEEFSQLYNNKTKMFDDEILNKLKEKYNKYNFILPINSNGNFGRWTCGYDKILTMIDNFEIEIKNNKAYQKEYFNTDRNSKVATLLLSDKNFYNGEGTTQLREIFDNRLFFETPKPTTLLQYLIQISTNPNDNDIILDFFAGSGTTAHAVMAQNLADNGNRKFILVQLDESIDEKKSKTAFEFCKNELKSEIPNISDITIERVKRAKKTLNSQMEFSVYEMTDEPDIDVQENLFGARQIINPLDLVTNMLLKSGNEISGKNIECVIENRLYKVGNDYFVLDLLQKDDKELFKVLDKDRNGNVYADIYINCDIEVWLNFYAKFKERLRIL